MSSEDEAGACDICKRGSLVQAKRKIAFRQWTSKGYISCRLIIPVTLCSVCGARHWDEAAEALIEEAVRREIGELS